MHVWHSCVEIDECCGAGQNAERPGGPADRRGKAKGGKLVALADLVQGMSPNVRNGSGRPRLPASLARVPVGPPGQNTPNRLQWNIEDVTVLLNGIQEYGSAFSPMLEQPSLSLLLATADSRA